ncbi:MAG TPA: rhodanese-like domain-containing protein [Thermoanaerobaculia bacterium]|jgi:rhodanese-related sulfurtransferase
MNASVVRRPLRWAAPLLILALLLGGCAHFRRSGKRPPYRKLSPPVAFEMVRDNPEMLILDLRPPQEYNGETGHLRRARNIPLARLPFRLLEISPFRDDTLLVYCDSGDCGEKGMAILQASGFENAVLMDGGIDAWIREGFKTVLPTTAMGKAGQPADGKGPVMPARPGEPQKETPVEPPPPPPGGAPVAAPRQIG